MKVVKDDDGEVRLVSSMISIGNTVVKTKSITSHDIILLIVNTVTKNW